MRLVILESPYKGENWQATDANVAYAKACMLECLEKGEAPFASHLLYTQCLDDKDPEERTLGICAGLAWGIVAQATVVYVDRGISEGMAEGIRRAKREGRVVEFRRLGEQSALNLLWQVA